MKMGIITILLTNPFSLCKSLLVCGIQTMFIVANTWAELVMTSINVHLNMFHKTMIWMIALVTLPVRVLTALQRERQLLDHLHDMQIELGNLVWDRKELQRQLQVSIKECRNLELMLSEVEDENDTLIAKYELLQGEFQDLKAENHKLQKIMGQNRQSSKASDDKDIVQNIGIADDNEYGISDGSQSYYKSGMLLEDLMMCKGTWESEGKTEAELVNLLKTCVARSSFRSCSHSTASESLDENEGLDQKRDAALSQSLFGAGLSFLVGMIIWTAEDPCMPLVVALFAVVGMSLKSVVQFFSTIKNKPASDAVALLSFNWFILGTLAYPALPTVARIFAPTVFAGFE